MIKFRKIDYNFWVSEAVNLNTIDKRKLTSFPYSCVRNYSPDIFQKKLNLIDNAVAEVSDVNLKTCIKDAYKKLAKTNFFPSQYDASFNEISALATNLNPKTDKVVIDEMCRRFKILSQNSNYRSAGRILSSIEQLAAIPAYSAGIATPINSSVIQVYNALLNKYKFLNFVKTHILKSPPQALNHALKREKLISILSPKNNIIYDKKMGAIVKPKQASYEFSSRIKKALYERYYLSNLPPENRRILSTINKKFRTFVFVPEDAKLYHLNKVLKEFEAWNMAGGKYVRNEKILDYCQFDGAFVDWGTSGYAMNNTVIRMRFFHCDDVEKLLRHEKMHVNDTIRNNPENIIKLQDTNFGFFGPHKEYDFRVNGKILTEKKWFRDELINGGVPKSYLDYAYTDRAEFIAVAAMGDTTRYSNNFKKVLVDLGVPEWFFNIK